MCVHELAFSLSHRLFISLFFSLSLSSSLCSLPRLRTPNQRALELLALPPDGAPRLLLDIGCGSGLSGEALSSAGHAWVGLDISPAMLDVAVEREVCAPQALLQLLHVGQRATVCISERCVYAALHTAPAAPH